MASGTLLIMFLAPAMVMMFARYVGLKVVDAEEDGLRVGNFLSEIFVPYREIADVRGVGWVSPRKIVVTLKRPCRFGQEIHFIPALSVMPISKHPALELLSERAGLSRARNV